MKQSYLESLESLQWLQEVHKINATEYRAAIVYGNEDSPTKVELFAKDHYKCKPTLYEADAEGVLRLTRLGQKPNPKFLTDRPLTAAESEKET